MGSDDRRSVTGDEVLAALYKAADLPDDFLGLHFEQLSIAKQLEVIRIYNNEVDARHALRVSFVAAPKEDFELSDEESFQDDLKHEHFNDDKQ